MASCNSFARLEDNVSLRMCDCRVRSHGVVLWSSDIWSSFEELAAMVPQARFAAHSRSPEFAMPRSLAIFWIGMRHE
eukprot:4081473-Pleurochrysis_carterae.AAC.2